MAKKDKWHDHVKKALENDGWIITHDPYWIKIEGVNYPVDLGGEKVIAAEKGNKKIVVEIKSFLAESIINEFHTVLGQYLDYETGLEEQEADREIYVAVPNKAWEKMEKLPFLLRVMDKYKMNIIVFETAQPKIDKWIPK